MEDQVLTQVDSLERPSSPNDWESWQARIRAILGIPTHNPLQAISLPDPWFLVPEQREVSDSDAAELFGVLRRFLLQRNSNKRVLPIVHRIRGLRSEDSLPLLYGMRHVAREKGSIGRYWPAFHEEILGGAVELRDVQTRLAPELAQVWLRLYEHTRGALYYPREGRRYIKWPLAHAGLLRQDEEVLLAFGESLIRDYGVTLAEAPVHPDDVEEFLQSLKEWLQATLGVAESRLARALFRRDGTQATIGELGQRWLRNHWEEIVAGRDRRQSARPRIIRSRLRFDPAQHRLLVIVPATEWPGDVGVGLKSAEREIVCPSQYAPAEDRTYCYPLSIPLLSPSPPDGALMSAADQEVHVRLPSVPEHAGLVFSSETGRPTRQWQLGETYYLVLPTQRFEDRAADTLFEEWVSLGSPDGAWQDHNVVWVRTRDPVLERSGDETETRIAKVIEGLEKATQRLGLPSFGHLWRPRLHLIGGTSLGTGPEDETHLVDDPPWLEIRGFWDEGLTLSLAKRDEESDEFVQYAVLQVPPPSSGGGQVVELWPETGESSEGQYRLETSSGTRLPIELRSAPVQGSLPQLQVRLVLHGEDGSTLDPPLTRRDLDRGTLTGRAWPLAQLTLEISSGTRGPRISVSADDRGRWSTPWRDLGVDLPADGRLDVVLTWRGCATARLAFADLPFVDQENIEIRFRDSEQGHTLEVSARVSGEASGRKARVLALGSRPWAGQLWVASERVAPSGLLRAQIGVPRGEVRWLGILPDDPLPEGDLAPPWFTASLSVPSPEEEYSLDRLDGTKWEEWAGLLAPLRIGSLPPGLRGLVGISLLGLFLGDHPRLLSLGPRWVELDRRRVWDRFAAWLDQGVTAPIAVFGLLPPAVLDSVPDPSPPFITIKLQGGLGSAIHDEGKQVPLECVLPVGAPLKLSSFLVPHLTSDSLTFALAAREGLDICSKCGLLLPREEFVAHMPPAKGLPSCTGRMRAYLPRQPGREFPAHVLLAWGWAALVDWLERLVIRLAAGESASVPQRAERLIDQLDARFSQQSDEESPRRWATSVVATERQVRRLSGQRNDSPVKLAQLGFRIDRHRDALDLVYRWLLDEMKDLHAAS